MPFWFLFLFPASRPQIDPSSHPLPFPVLPLYSRVLIKYHLKTSFGNQFRALTRDHFATSYFFVFGWYKEWNDLPGQDGRAIWWRFFFSLKWTKRNKRDQEVLSGFAALLTFCSWPVPSLSFIFCRYSTLTQFSKSNMAVCTVRSLRFIKTVLELISHAIHSTS